MRLDWEQQTYTYNWLKIQAESSPDFGSAYAWLKRIGVVPVNAKWKRKVEAANFPNDAIPAWFLAGRALEWDSWGSGSTPIEFVKSIAFEITGTEERGVLREVLEGLTK